METDVQEPEKMSQEVRFKNSRSGGKLTMADEQKRTDAAGSVDVRLASIVLKRGEKFAHFDVIKKGRAVYATGIGEIPSMDDFCSCGDFTNRNTEYYWDTHGHTLQCKHIIKSRSAVDWLASV